MKPWIGVDLDGTLAEDIPHGPFDPFKIGAPIPRMVRRVKYHLNSGDTVKIFTARACSIDHHTVFNGTAEEYLERVVAAIKAWCLEYIGVELEVTNQKDYGMKLLYDDRAVAVNRNEGTTIGCINCTDIL